MIEFRDQLEREFWCRMVGQYAISIGRMAGRNAAGETEAFADQMLIELRKRSAGLGDDEGPYR